MPINNLEEKRRKARELGFTDEQIAAYEQSKIGGGPNITPTPAPTSQSGNKNMENFGWIPALFGLGGGIAGGAVGGAASLPIGSVPGAIVGGGAGTAAGTGAGIAVQNSLQDLFGTQAENPLDQVKNMLSQSGKAAGYDVAGGAALGGIGALLSAIARPAGKFVYQAASKVPKSQAKALLNKGDDISRVINKMMDEGYGGNPKGWISKARGSQQKVWQSLKNIVSKDPNAIPVDELENMYLDTITKNNTGLNIADEEVDTVLKAAEKYFKSLRRERGGVVSLDDLIEKNTSANRSLYNQSGNKSTSQAASKMVQDDMSSIIKDYIAGGNKDVSNLLDEYGLYKNIEKIGIDRAADSPRLPTSIQRLLDQTLANPNFGTKLGLNMAKSTGSSYPGLSPLITLLFNLGMSDENKQQKTN